MGTLNLRPSTYNSAAVRMKEIMMSKQNWSIDGDFFKVLVNSEGQHSLWPASKEIPRGWEQKGETVTKEEFLEKVNSVWLYIKPKSLNNSKPSQ